MIQTTNLAFLATFLTTVFFTFLLGDNSNNSCCAKFRQILGFKRAELPLGGPGVVLVRHCRFCGVFLKALVGLGEEATVMGFSGVETVGLTPALAALATRRRGKMSLNSSDTDTMSAMTFPTKLVGLMRCPGTCQLGQGISSVPSRPGGSAMRLKLSATIPFLRYS